MEGTQRKRPTEFLNSIKGKPVIVRLNSGVIYRGARFSFAVSRSSQAILPKKQERWPAWTVS